MVDQPEIGTNTSYLIDFIQITPFCKQARNDRIRQLHSQSGLSTNQIAQKLGVSKTSVIESLHDMGIRSGSSGGPRTNPDNYRCPTPPYGYRVKDSRLVVYKPELKICRLVVHLIGHEKYSATKTAKELTSRHIKNKQGTLYWDHKIVKRIFDRWNGKI